MHDDDYDPDEILGEPEDDSDDEEDDEVEEIDLEREKPIFDLDTEDDDFWDFGA